MTRPKAARPSQYEPLDSRPVAMPAGMRKPPSLNDEIGRMVRGYFSSQAAANGQETFEESLDFGEDEDDATPWEHQADARAIRLEMMEQAAYEQALAEQAGRRRARQQQQQQGPQKPPQASPEGAPGGKGAGAPKAPSSEPKADD